MKKIVVAVDSFKGCLGSLEVADAIEAGIKAVHPRCEVVKVPVADGGEGTVQALVGATGGRMRALTVTGPLGRPVRAAYGILGPATANVAVNTTAATAANSPANAASANATAAVANAHATAADINSTANIANAHAATPDSPAATANSLAITANANSTAAAANANSTTAANAHATADINAAAANAAAHTAAGTAIIEMAAASGLPLVPPGERNPMETTTRGTGELIADALARGCRRIILGIGGSATNDAGAGMLQALGYRFFDAAGAELGRGGKILERIARVDAAGANPLLRETEFRVACDVDNPFHGPRGAAHVYGPQKGADPQMVAALDRGLARFAGVIRAHTGRDIAAAPGAGAAGGLGGALLAFLDARLQPGIALVLETLRFDELLAGASLVITGEGRMDAQTAMGKAPQGVAAAAARCGVPVIALAGGVEDAAAINRLGIAGVFSIMPRPMSLQDAMAPGTAAKNIRVLVTQLFQTLAATRS